MSADTIFHEHLTKDGERWDLIAFKWYGDPLLYEPIIRANPDVPITPSLPGGLTLWIPVIEAPVASLEELPPWKR